MSLASLSMLLMSANSPSGWPGMISNFVMFVQVPLLSWSGLSLASGSTYLCSSAVLGLPIVNIILLDSGVPMVLLAQSVLAIWFCRSSSYGFIIFSFSFCLKLVFLLLFVLGCRLSALLPGPFVRSDSAPSVWWGVTRIVFSVFVLVPPAFFNLSFSAV